MTNLSEIGSKQVLIELVLGLKTPIRLYYQVKNGFRTIREEKEEDGMVIKFWLLIGVMTDMPLSIVSMKTVN